ncbi:uncharacterized protein LOC118492125 [Helianthus annuus]|uniref:uncharacterized protein LOC118492125 n=1 Tax=Helianthus annuus TaxID=4232 RepID=UPI001652E38C|nr:uncharacterized protein LOC118492125 [Helianthus annuus]
MANKVLAAKELEVVSGSGTESKSKVSQNDQINESGKKAKTESNCKNCMKDYKVCSTLAYLSGKKTKELTKRVRDVEDQILNRDKMLEASNERSKELTEKIEKDKNDVEKLGKKTKKVLRVKEEKINQQLDEIAKLKLQFQEAKIENECIQLKLNSYNSTSFVLQHIVPKPIGKNKAGEDVYSDGIGVGYHQYLEPFGSPCTVIEPRGKFGPKSVEGIFVGYASPMKRVFVPSYKKIIKAYNVDCQGYNMLPHYLGDGWRYDYDTLWKSFDEEEDSDFFDELDILREYESSQERFPAEYYRSQRQTSNDNEAGPSNAGEHDDTQQSSEHASENQTAVNDNQEYDNRPLKERRAAKEQKQKKCENVDQKEETVQNEEVKIVETKKVIEAKKIIEEEKIVKDIKPCLKCLESCKECAAKDEKLAEFEKIKEQLLFNLNYVKESYDVLNRTVTSLQKTNSEREDALTMMNVAMMSKQKAINHYIEECAKLKHALYVDIRSLKAMGIIAETDNGDRLKGLDNEVWDPLPLEPADDDEVMHDEDKEEHQQPPHTPPHQEPEPQQFQHWPPGIPSYPEFYGQFQQMQISQEQQCVNIEQLRANQEQQLRANQEAMRANQDFMRQEEVVRRIRKIIRIFEKIKFPKLLAGEIDCTGEID